MKIYCLLLFACFSTTAKSQDTDVYWKQWNKNYPEKAVLEVLKSEYDYALDVENDPSIVQYYVRKDPFRFKAVYLGKHKTIDTDTKRSMKQVLKLTKLDASIIDKLCQRAVLMKIGHRQMWMPIQKQVFVGFMEEVKKGDEITLYCLFLNEHTLNKILYNTFLISEFTKP